MPEKLRLQSAVQQKLDKAELRIEASLSYEGGRLMIEFPRVSGPALS
jgi:hypothetical protein